jgi:hypothetical protein
VPSCPSRSCSPLRRWGVSALTFRAARAERGITACIPPKQNRKPPIAYDTAL